MLTEITKYFEGCILLDDKVVWEYFENKNHLKNHPERTNNLLADKLEIKEQVAE